jgi:hypothetical protein
MNLFKRIIIKYFELDPEPCESCETLKEQLNIANHEKKEMLDTILSFTKPIVEEKPIDTRTIEPIRPKASTWAIRRQELEKNDRITADANRQRQADIEKLEKELLPKEEAKEEKANAS